MSYKQAILAALIIAIVCCGVMWMLEDFRQAKMLADFRTELNKLPTIIRETDA